MIGNLSNVPMGLAGASLISPIQENLFIAGMSYSFEDYFIMDTGNVFHILFDPTAFVGVNITINPIQFGATGGPILIQYYSGSSADSAGGTILAPTNRRFGSPLPKSTLYLNGNNWNAGAQFAGDLILSNSLNPANQNPGSSLPGLPFEINPAVKYGILLTNTGGDGVYVQMKITWFEA